jgi:hypothetical protein
MPQTSSANVPESPSRRKARSMSRAGIQGVVWITDASGPSGHMATTAAARPIGTAASSHAARCAKARYTSGVSPALSSGMMISHSIR